MVYHVSSIKGFSVNYEWIFHIDNKVKGRSNI